jgi:hypothetical protein
MDPGLGLGISITPVFGLAKQWFASNGLQAMVCKQWFASNGLQASRKL